MVAHARPRLITPQEYLDAEREAETRHEYHAGVIVAMAGASWEHNIITNNASRRLGNQLEDSSCVVVSQDMRVVVPDCGMYYYPDVLVVCGEARFEDSAFDTLLNPKLIVEVLSPSTEQKDRQEKFNCYKTLESLTDYVLIAQDAPRGEHFARGEGGDWEHHVAEGLATVLELLSIGCTLRLADVYARVAFATADAATKSRNETN